MDRDMLLAAFKSLYVLGSNATKAVNFGRNGFTKTMEKNERRTINRRLRDLGLPKLTDEEYDAMCCG